MKHDGKCEKMTMFWNARAIRIAQPCHIVAATERLKGYIQNWTSWVTGQGGAMIRSNATRGEDADQGPPFPLLDRTERVRLRAPEDRQRRPRCAQFGPNWLG